MAFTQVTVTGTVTMSNATPAVGAEVIFTLNTAMSDGVQVVAPRALAAICNSSGAFSIVLNANDDTTTQPIGTYYSVVVTYGSTPIETFNVVVPHAGAPTVNLFTLANLTNPNVAQPYVSQLIAGAGITLSPANGTGIVTLTSGASGSWVATVSTAAATYTVAAGDQVKLLDATSGAFTVNLPAASGSGRYLMWKAINTNTNIVTITPNGSDKVDGASNTTVGPSGSSASWTALELIDASSGAWRSI